MTQDEIHEASRLCSTHESLRYNIARNSNDAIGLYAIDDDSRTSQPHLPAKMAGTIWMVALALVESRLRELGVDPKQGLDRECFDCGGTGKKPIS